MDPQQQKTTHTQAETTSTTTIDNIVTNAAHRKSNDKIQTT